MRVVPPSTHAPGRLALLVYAWASLLTGGAWAVGVGPLSHFDVILVLAYLIAGVLFTVTAWTWRRDTFMAAVAVLLFATMERLGELLLYAGEGSAAERCERFGVNVMLAMSLVLVAAFAVSRARLRGDP